MGNRDVDLEITGSPEGLEAALARAKSAVRGAVGDMESSFKGVQAAISKVQGIMLAFTAVLGGGAAFKAAVDATVNLSKESITLGRTLGIGASQASILKTALGDVYATTDQVTAATAKIAATLNKDEQAFTRLGVATRDSNGHFRNSLDILLDVNSKLSGLKEGTDRNVAGVQIFGKAWASMEPLIRLNAKAMEDAAAKAKALGLVVGQEDVEATTKYRAALNDAEDVMKALEKTIGDALLPSLTETAQWFSDVGPTAIRALKIVIAEISTVLIALVATFKGVYETMVSGVEQLMAVFVTLGRVISLALHGDFQGAKAAWADGMDTIVSIGTTWADKMVTIQQQAASDVADAWEKALNPKATTPVAPPGGGGTSETAESRKGAATGWQTGLDEAKAAWSEQQRLEGSFREFSKAQEIAYWQNILATQRASHQEQLAIRSKIAVLELAMDKEKFNAIVENLKAEEAAFKNDGEAKLELSRQVAERMRQAYGDDSKEYAAARKDVIATERQVTEQTVQQQQIRTQSARDSALAGIDAEEAAAGERTSLNLATTGDLLAQEEDFENRRYQIKLQAAQENKLLAMDGGNPVEVAQRQAEIEELERQHQARLRQIRSQEARESNKYWLAAQKQMEGGFKSAISSMLKGCTTLAQGIKQMTAAVVGAVIDMISQIAAEWLVAQIAQLVATKAATGGKIASYAAEAGAAGTASFAGAPWPIDMGAPAFGASMAALAGSYSAGLSASGGFEVPAGLNPVTQLHQREMVLPSHLADPLREMLGAGGSGRPVNFNVSAVDTRGFEKLLARNARALTALVEKQMRQRFHR